MFEKSLIVRSGQSWKIVLAIVVAIGGCVTMVWGPRVPLDASSYLGTALGLGGALVALLSWIFACATVRCHRCRAPWLWLAVSQKSVSEWAFWFMTLDACPRCGDRADGRVANG